MTAQLPSKTFGVESLNTELADQILREGTYVSKFNFQNTIVLDKSTGKCYEVNSDKSGASGFFRGRPPQTMHDCISKGIDLYICPKYCTFAPYFIKV